MTWLVHHEFGLDHRPFEFARDPLGQGTKLDPFSTEYWNQIWIGTYRWLEETAPPNATFVCYEDLCRNPAVWTGIAELCDAPSEIEGEEFFAEVPPAKGDSDAMKVYHRLREKSLSQLSLT